MPEGTLSGPSKPTTSTTSDDPGVVSLGLCASSQGSGPRRGGAGCPGPIRPSRVDDEAGHPTRPRNDLHIAIYLDRWAKAESGRTDTDARYTAGYVQALVDVAAFVRQTYYLPEGGHPS
jgi:hypothetical protein